MARPVRRRIAALLAAIVATVVVTGCGGAEPAAPAAPASPFPPRPESIDVSRLDPCTGIPAAEAERLDLDSGTPGTATVNGMRSPSCIWIGYHSQAYGYSAQSIPLSAAGASGEQGSRVIDINGFGAVQGSPTTNNGPGLPAFCQIAIDVADGQTLRIQVDNGDPTTGGDPAAIDSVCAEARRFGSLYLETVRR